mgnify:CR=1 FL=1
MVSWSLRASLYRLTKTLHCSKYQYHLCYWSDQTKIKMKLKVLIILISVCLSISITISAKKVDKKAKKFHVNKSITTFLTEVSTLNNWNNCFCVNYDIILIDWLISYFREFVGGTNHAKRHFSVCFVVDVLSGHSAVLLDAITKHTAPTHILVMCGFKSNSIIIIMQNYFNLFLT